MYDPLFHVVLHSPQIPHNTGSVGRTCTAIGAKLWLIRPFGFRLDDYYLRRAGLDYWEKLCWEPLDDWAALLTKLPDARLWFFTKKATRLYTDVQFEGSYPATSSQWDAGDRSYYCFVNRSSGDPLTGSLAVAPAAEGVEVPTP